MTGRADGTRWAGVALGLALAVLATFQQYKLPPVLPILLDAYGYPKVLAGGFMAVYALVGLIFSVGAGRALDRLGFRLVEAACVLFAVGGALTLAWPESGIVVLGARALEGFGYTVLAIAGPALANRSAGPVQIVFVAGVVAAWVPIGQLLANAVAYPFADAGWWQVPWVAALAAALAVFAWVRLARRHGFALGVSAEAARAARPDAEEHLALVLASAVFMLWAGQYIGFMSWLNEYLVRGLGLSAGAAVGAASLAAGAVVVFNVTTGWALRAGMPIGPVFVGSIMVEACAWFAAPWLDGPLGLAVLTLYGVACGLTPVCLFAMPALIVGRDRVGASAFGVLMRGRNVGVFAGPLLLPLVSDAFGGWDAVWPVYGAITLVAGAGAFILARRVGALRRAKDSADSRRPR